MKRLVWRGKDSDLRSYKQQIYSLSPLTAREPLQFQRRLRKYPISPYFVKVIREETEMK